MDRFRRIPFSEQNPKTRTRNFDEVCIGYSEVEAVLEASRCLQCKDPMCIKKCPVNIDIPYFIYCIRNRKFVEAIKVIDKFSSLPGICGRVCPQEVQCESGCTLGKQGEAIAIGKLERFIADYQMKNSIQLCNNQIDINKKVAVVGSGPSGLTCASELAKKGYKVTIFEALHKPGGVLVYGIPEFRLPKDTVVNFEINKLKQLGVKIETNVIVGKTVLIDELIKEEGYEAIFIGSGAGLPKFMGIKGENLNGVFSANEFLTRNNLMKAFKEEYRTPIAKGKRVAVIGGGNVAIDAARTALRLGGEVYIIYRRSQCEMPARKEEYIHALEEGIQFKFLTNIVEIIGDVNAEVQGVKCIRMKLDEISKDGRHKPIPVPNSEYFLEVDEVIMALGTSPNELIPTTTKGLKIDRNKCIVVDSKSLATSIPRIFAGGDAVSGSSTVISAMESGKKAADSIHKYLSSKN